MASETQSCSAAAGLVWTKSQGTAERLDYQGLVVLFGTGHPIARRNGSGLRQGKDFTRAVPSKDCPHAVAPEMASAMS